MTIEVGVLNHSQSHCVEVLYSDSNLATGGTTESLAVVLNPGEGNKFWIHSTRHLIVMEKQVVAEMPVVEMPKEIEVEESKEE